MNSQGWDYFFNRELKDISTALDDRHLDCRASHGRGFVHALWASNQISFDRSIELDAQIEEANMARSVELGKRYDAAVAKVQA